MKNQTTTTSSDFCINQIMCFQVVVLSTRPLATKPQRSAGDVPFISSAERKTPRSRRSSLIDWESSLEDVKVGISARISFITVCYFTAVFWIFPFPGFNDSPDEPS